MVCVEFFIVTLTQEFWQNHNKQETIRIRMAAFMKTKFNKSDDQTNIEKYRIAANIIEYHVISKLIFQKS